MSALLERPPESRRILTGHGKTVARFAGRFVVQTKGRWAGQLLALEPWQVDFLDELFLVYEDGERVYSEALLGIARKNGKSTIASVLGLYGLLASLEASPEVYVAAASKDQARVIFGQAVDYIEASPRLRDWLKPQRSAILCPSNGGVFRVLAADAPQQYGLNPSLVLLDELWASNAELYYALTTGSGARLNPLIVSTTTAGWDRDTICYSLYERGKKLMAAGGVAAMRREGFLCRWYEADPDKPADDRSTWKQGNPSSWITMKGLEREYARLPESVFRRLHLNQWTESADAWITGLLWDGRKGKPVLVGDAPTWMAVDVGIKRDSAAITIGQWQDDKLVTEQRIMRPEDDATMGVADVRAAVGEIAAAFSQLREVNYDPWSFRESAEILAEQGLPMVEFPQTSSRMAPASETIYELINEDRLVHDGDPVAREQALAAVVAPTERGGWRISKRKSLERIDYAISLAMLADRAVTQRFVKPKRRGVQFH